MVVVLQEAESVCMTESVRQQWLYSTQACTANHDAMTSLAGKHHITTYSACGV